MKLSDAEIQELQAKYRHLTNYEAEEADAPIDPLAYVDSNGDSLLHLAVQRGDVRSVELLLSAGMDVDQVGDMGNTPLHHAQTEAMAELLLRHGATVGVQNEFGETPGWPAQWTCTPPPRVLGAIDPVGGCQDEEAPSTE